MDRKIKKMLPLLWDLQTMTKYTSNKQYEKDKALLIEKFKKDLDNIYSLDPLDVADVLNLLKQSKWIGAVDGNVYAKGHRTNSPIINNQPINKPCTLLKDVDTTTIPN